MHGPTKLVGLAKFLRKFQRLPGGDTTRSVAVFFLALFLKDFLKYVP
jgi:hypothetical protein